MSAKADEARIAALEAEMAELRAKVDPPEPPKFEPGPRGPTTTELAMSKMSMPPQAMRVMIEAVGDDAMRGIVRDGRAGQVLAPLAAEGRSSPRLPQGMREPSALGPPGGQRTQDLIGKLLDVDDARQRAQLIEREAHRLAKK
jgi:hypothetical protein